MWAHTRSIPPPRTTHSAPKVVNGLRIGFLHLADNRGWLFDTQPSSGTKLLGEARLSAAAAAAAPLPPPSAAASLADVAGAPPPKPLRTGADRSAPHPMSAALVRRVAQSRAQQPALAPAPAHSGWLAHRVGDQWANRWFVVQGGALDCYSAPSDDLPTSSAALAGLKLRLADTGDSLHFAIAAAGGVRWLMRAASGEARSDWARALTSGALAATSSAPLLSGTGASAAPELIDTFRPPPKSVKSLLGRSVRRTEGHHLSGTFLSRARSSPTPIASRSGALPATTSFGERKRFA